MAVTKRLTEQERMIRMASVRTLAMLRTSMDLDFLSKKDYRVINTPEGLDWVQAEMKKRELFSIDTETTGLNICSLSKDNPIKDYIVGFSISWERDQGIYIPLAHTRFANLDKHLVFRKLGHLLETKTFVTHNGLFDGKVFYDEGILLNICHDTMLMAFNIDSRVSKGSKGLKPMTERRYLHPVIEFSDIFISTQDYSLFRELDEDLVQAYACADADYTLMLFTDMFSELQPRQIRSYLLDIVAQRHLVRSEYYGKGLDTQLIQTLAEVNNKDLTRLEEMIFKYTGNLLNSKYGLPLDSTYTFDLGSSDALTQLLVGELGYPVEKRNKSGKLSVDKFVLNALVSEKDPTTDPLFEAVVGEQGSIESSIKDYGFDWVKPEDKHLIPTSGKKNIRDCKYKLAVLIQKWRKLEKLRSSFFSVLMSNNYEGKYYSPILMTRAETARIIDPMQTLVGHLKRLIVPLDPANQYIIDSDFAQIEYRTMAGTSHVQWLVDRLQHPEADYHREGGSLVLNKRPEEITKDERNSLKSIHFGIPYGMSAKGVMEARYGISMTPEQRKVRMAEIEAMLAAWEKNLFEIKDMLNRYRDTALQEVSQEELPWTLKGQCVSRIYNELGRSRVFDVSNLNRAKSGSIRRQAGNFPIQSYAREIFVFAFTNLCRRAVEEGFMDIRVPDASRGSGYRFENKMGIMAYIHDEMLMTVDKDINPFYLYKMIYEECMIYIEGHPKYFCGINVVSNWYEGKGDTFEAPVRFVEEVIENITEADKYWKCDGIPRDVVLDRIKAYIFRRLQEEISALYPEITTTDCVDFRQILPKFTSYFLIGKLFDYIKPTRPVLLTEKGEPEETDALCARLEVVIFQTWGITRYLYKDGRLGIRTDAEKMAYSWVGKTHVFSQAPSTDNTSYEDSLVLNAADLLGYQFSYEWDAALDSEDWSIDDIYDKVSLSV